MRPRWSLLALCTAAAACGADANGPDTTVPELPVAAVIISPVMFVLVPDSTVQLTAVLTDSLGHALSGRAITWTSSDTTTAVVSASGMVRGRAFPAWMPTGYALIRAAAEGKTGAASAVVLRKLAGLRTLPESLTIFTGQTSLLEAAVADTAGRWVRVGHATWSSADTTRAVVDSFGTVRGVRAGTAQITSRAAGLSATATVTVRSPVTSVAIEPAETTLVIGQSLQLTAVLRDSAGNALTGRPVTWTILGRDIATLTAAGLATARIAGPTRIVATVEGRADTASFTARVDGPFRTVAAGELHTCATTTAGTTYCWGNGWYGQLGTGSGVAGPTASAARVAATVQFRSLAAQGHRTCGLDAAGVAFCWGLDSHGALGNSAGVAPCTYGELCRGTPLEVTDTTHFAALSAGGWHACGLSASGAADCWGENWLGQLGVGTHDLLPHAPTPVTGGLAFTALAAGGVHTCGLADGGQAYCWGAYLQGQTIDSVASAVPQSVAGAPALVAIAAGSFHVCGLTAAGAAYCWGEAYPLTPALVSGAGAFTRIVTGSAYSCALDAAGAAYCWGANDYGQLGNGTTAAAATPVAVSGGLHFSALWAGAYHACGLATSGLLYCWGDNYNGEIGNGTYQPVPVPTLVLGQP